MGCGDSKSGPVLQFEIYPSIPLAEYGMEMDNCQSFENEFPLYRMQILEYEARVKRFVFKKSSVSMN